MRKALVAASLVALLVVLYAVAGYWLAPRFLQDALVERAGRLGLALELAEVRTDPFALQVTLDGVRVLARGRELARSERLVLDLAWASLWRDAWIVQQATLHQPSAQVVVGPAGELSWPLPRNGAAGQGPSIFIRRLAIDDGAMHLVDRSRAAPVELNLRAVNLQAHGLSTRQGTPARYELSAREARGGLVSSQGSLALDPLFAQGTLGVQAAPLATLWAAAAAPGDAASGEVQGSAKYSYDGKVLVLSEVTLQGTGVAHSGVELSQVQLRSPRIALPSQDGFELEATARLAPEGDIRASGRVALQPFSARLGLELGGLPLRQAGAFLPRDLGVTIASGALSASGQARVGPDGAHFEGSIAVRGVRVEQRGSGEVLLAWDNLHTDAASLAFAPFRAEFGEVVARAPAARLVIREDGKLNVAAALGNGRPGEGGAAPHVAVRRLRVENGTLDFADHSLDNDFAVTVRELAGAVTGFSTRADDPARIQLSGRVDQYGSARIRGAIDFASPKSLTNVVGTFRNVPLAALTPYIVKFAGYRVESGRVSAELRYRVREGRLVGQNQLTFEQLALGEKVQRAGARDLPLELAVALLADANGRIHLDIPVSGNLNDPQFDFGGLVARALGNVVSRIVSAPFRVLAGVFGKRGADLDRVAFAPGSAALAPPAEETVARVAAALGERPRLSLAVQGGYDAQADAEALRRDTARRAIAQRAGVAMKGPLDFGDPKVLQAAERMYLERAGNRLQMLELREKDRRYGRVLLDEIAATLEVDAQSVETLARARAETVRAALLTHGIDPARVRLEAPERSAAGKEGVPTVLALDTGRSAAAGATAP